MEQNSDGLPKESFTEAGGELTEAIFDNLLGEGILKDIPVFGSIWKIYKGARDIQSYLFVKKLEKFLRELSDVPEDKIAEFREKLDQDPEFQEKVTDKLMLILEKFDDIGKAKLLAKAFAGYLKQTITYDAFLDLSMAINDIKIHYLPKVDSAISFSWKEEFYDIILTNEDYHMLENAGLVRAVNNINEEVDEDGTPKPGLRKAYRYEVKTNYEVTPLGGLFSYIVLENPSDFWNSILTKK